MSEKIKVDIKECDNWQVLYINNELFSEGHSISLDEMLQLLSDFDVIEYGGSEFYEYDDMENEIKFPDTADGEVQILKDEG